ncbi:hypothetical protein ACI2KV_24550 [Micromonospora chokoriensis]
MADVARLGRTGSLASISNAQVLKLSAQWRVIELGDGQVSDRPNTIASQTMIDILLARAADRLFA